MQHSTVVQYKPKEPLLNPEALPLWLQNDKRWSLAKSVVAGPHFARSPLLSKFLLFVVAETIQGREGEITEHQIGVQVFDRPRCYRTIEDNIVRSYARQLRKRLSDHFAAEGSSETLRIDIPLGGYIPFFIGVSEEHPHGDAAMLPVVEGIQAEPTASQNILAAVAPRRSRKSWLLRASLIAAYTSAIICVTWFAAVRGRAPQLRPEPAHLLWATLFDGPGNSYIVPADAGFNLLEDLSRRSLPLADYIKGGYANLPVAGIDAHSADDLHSQQFTSFIDFQIVAALAHLAEYNPQRIFLRFPRDLRLDDLKNANAILIGSVGSNPWAAIADGSCNFRIVYGEGMEGATIVNANPQPGEAPSYASHWSEPAHQTFALISFVPNLGGNGHLLLLQGLDIAGTQAAAEVLFQLPEIGPVLRQATRPDGSLRSFQILLQSTSIESNSAGTHVLASRIY